MADNNRNQHNIAKSSNEEPQFSAEIAKQFLINQAENIRLQHRQVDSQNQKDAHQLEYAKEILKVQSSQAEQERKFLSSESTKTKAVLFLTFLVLVVFLCVMVYLGKEQLALEVVKYIGTFLAGIVGGYGYSQSKRYKKENQE